METGQNVNQSVFSRAKMIQDRGSTSTLLCVGDVAVWLMSKPRKQTATSPGRKVHSVPSNAAAGDDDDRISHRIMPNDEKLTYCCSVSLSCHVSKPPNYYEGG